MIKNNVKCDNCSKEFHLKPFRIARAKFHYCSVECKNEHTVKKTIERIEIKLGVKSLKEYLHEKYIEELKSSTEIALIVYGNGEDCNGIISFLRYFNIPVRGLSESAKAQFSGDKREIRSQQSRVNANKNFNTKESRDKLRKAMKSDEYIEKCRVAKIGELNGMFGIRGEENAKWNPNKTREQRHKDRKLFENKEWRNKVFERDNYICQITGIRGGRLVAHHLDGYCLNIEERFKTDNGITISESVHKLFHHNYGSGKNTRKQFEEFKQNYNLTSAI